MARTRDPESRSHVLPTELAGLDGVLLVAFVFGCSGCVGGHCVAPLRAVVRARRGIVEG